MPTAKQHCVICGVLIFSVTASGLLYCGEHTHVESQVVAPSATQTVAASSASTRGYGLSPYGSTGYGG